LISSGKEKEEQIQKPSLGSVSIETNDWRYPENHVDRLQHVDEHSLPEFDYFSCAFTCFILEKSEIFPCYAAG